MEAGQGRETGGGGSGVVSESFIPDLSETEVWSFDEMLRREKAALGFFVSAHPLDPWRGLLDGIGAADVQRLWDLEDGSQVVLGGVPTTIKTSRDKKGQTMAFVGMEDFTGTVECIAFADAFAQCRGLLAGDRPLLFKGRLSHREQEKPKVLLEEAYCLTDLVDEGKLTLHLALSTGLGDEVLAGIRRRLEAASGRCPVILHIDHRKLGGVQMKLRDLRVRPEPELVAALREIAGQTELRLTMGEYRGGRSVDLFGDERVSRRTGSRRRSAVDLPAEQFAGVGEED